MPIQADNSMAKNEKTLLLTFLTNWPKKIIGLFYPIVKFRENWDLQKYLEFINLNFLEVVQSLNSQSKGFKFVPAKAI